MKSADQTIHQHGRLKSIYILNYCFISTSTIISILNSVFKCYLDVYLLTLVNCEGYTMYVDTFYKMSVQEALYM